MENKITIRKVPLISLLHTLGQLYDKGVDFIDIHGEVENGQDTLSVSIKREYMNPEYLQNLIDEEENKEKEQYPSKVEVKLSDEDLNQLT